MNYPLKTLASSWLKGLVPRQREAKSVRAMHATKVGGDGPRGVAEKTTSSRTPPFL